MQNTIIDTKPMKEQRIIAMAEEVKALPSAPAMLVISVGEDPASKVYMKNKINLAKDCGLIAHHLALGGDIVEQTLLDEIARASKVYHGIILQLPLMNKNPIDVTKVLNAIPHTHDCDGLTFMNQAYLYNNLEEAIVPATAQAVLDFIQEIDYPLAGKDVLLVGKSNLVGKPLIHLLMNKGATVTIAHSRTEDLPVLIQSGAYDVIVSATGKAKIFTRPCTDVLIDVSICFDEEGRMCGDFDISKGSYEFATIPPNKGLGIKGGIGSLTSANVCANVIKCYKIQKGLL